MYRVHGAAPCDKLYEEWLAAADSTLPTPVRQLRVARLDDRKSQILDLLAWSRSVLRSDGAAVQRQLARLVPEYRPVEA